ncbi:putative transcription factor GRF family [Arabidopsis thaliana]
MVSHSSESNANSASRNWGPLCNCGRATTVVKAWTNENPGKRFFRCGAHGFFDWADVEKAYSWQKEIKALKESLKAMSCQDLSGSTTMNRGLVKLDEQEKEKLENEVVVANERKKKCFVSLLCSLGKASLLSMGWYLVLAMGK